MKKGQTKNNYDIPLIESLRNDKKSWAKISKITDISKESILSHMNTYYDIKFVPKKSQKR